MVVPQEAEGLSHLPVKALREGLNGIQHLSQALAEERYRAAGEVYLQLVRLRAEQARRAPGTAPPPPELRRWRRTGWR